MHAVVHVVDAEHAEHAEHAELLVLEVQEAAQGMTCPGTVMHGWHKGDFGTLLMGISTATYV